MCHNKMVDENTRKEKKTRVITFYHKGKEGVHTMEQMVGTYIHKYQTQSGPMVLWYILDIATLNAYTFFRGQHPQIKSSVTSARCVFVNEFSRELFTSHMRSWLEGCCNCKPNHWSNGKVYDDKCHNSATGKKKAEGLTKEMEVSDVSEQSTICGKSTCVQWLELETEAAI